MSTVIGPGRTEIRCIVSIIIVAPILWLVGRALVGKEKAKFTDAIWIVVIGVIAGAIINAIIPYVGFIISLIIWLYLVKRFFDCGWLKAFVIAIIALIVMAIIAAVLVLLGFGVLSALIL